MNTTPASGRPATIRLFLVDGGPEGIRAVSKSNWAGVGVVTHRNQLSEALARDELARPGIYFLTGTDLNVLSRIHIGEADVLRKRIKRHRAKKDFWTQLTAFSSTSEDTKKARIRYLEAALIEQADSVNQWAVDNTNAPSTPPLSEADRADADVFLSEVLSILPILGIDAFVSSQRPSDGARQVLYLNARKAEGTGEEPEGGFVVHKGSCGQAAVVESFPSASRRYRDGLVERGVLQQEGDRLVFTQDHRFASPSAAATVLTGRSMNGRGAWKTQDGVSLRDLLGPEAP